MIEINKFFAYILYSESFDSYYIGYTSDLNKRLLLHNKGAVKSTKSKRPWEIFYFELFDSKTDAIKREYEIKRMKSR